jgi:hypothetical protein
MNYKNILFILLSLIFIACEKEELPVKPFDRGNAITTTVNMDPTYKYQIFYKLSSDSIISINLKTNWDIAFDCSEENHLMLNASKSMFVRKMDTHDFSLVSDTSGFRNNRTWDRSNGNMDSTAFGTLENNSAVYIIDRGYNEMSIHLGFKKLQIVNISNNSYTIRYANLNGSEEQTVSIEKNPDHNFLAFSFNTNTTVQVEPKKTEYDLQFTQYTYTFYNPYQPYAVTGVLHNRSGITVAIEKDKPFAEILLQDTIHYQFSSNQDAIGYDWKEFNLNTNKFTVNPNIIYIIKDQQGFYYKLHFIDFYNEGGLKGNPKFEFQKL